MSGYIKNVLPVLMRRFNGSKLVFLMGSDVALSISRWPDADLLCKNNELVVAMRQDDNLSEVKAVLALLPVQPDKILIFESPHPDLKSSLLKVKV